MRLRAIVPTLLFAGVVVVAVALGPLPSLAVGSRAVAEPPTDAGAVYVQVQAEMLDGTCVALDPAVARPILREEMCALFCLEPTSAEVDVAPSTIVLRRSPLEDRQAAAEELLFDVPIMDTNAAAAAIPDVAERFGLDELALREAVGLARERALMRMQDEGMLDEANFACLLLRTRDAFRLCYQEPASTP